jgi:hypothetical protein
MAIGDEVGFGKPPKHSQFRKGISGNPKGRPKGTRNLATVLANALQERVIINENGRRRTVTKLDAAVKQLVDKAASGDLAAMRPLMILAGSTEDHSADPLEKQAPEVDLRVMRGVLKRLEGCLQEDKNETEQQ